MQYGNHGNARISRISKLFVRVANTVSVIDVDGAILSGNNENVIACAIDEAFDMHLLINVD